MGEEARRAGDRVMACFVGRLLGIGDELENFWNICCFGLIIWSMIGMANVSSFSIFIHF